MVGGVWSLRCLIGRATPPCLVERDLPLCRVFRRDLRLSGCSVGVEPLSCLPPLGKVPGGESDLYHLLPGADLPFVRVEDDEAWNADYWNL